MSRYLAFWIWVVSCVALGAQAATPLSTLPTEHVEIIPYIPFQDLRALIAPGKHVGDRDYPKLKTYPHEDELVARCVTDMELSTKENPNPLHLFRPLPPGKLMLDSIHRNPDSGIIYFVFTYDSELVYDLSVIYYYDPKQDRFILKSTI